MYELDLNEYRLAENIKKKVAKSISKILDAQKRIHTEMIVIGDELRSIKEIAPLDIFPKVVKALGIGETEANHYMRISRTVERTPRVALMKTPALKELFKKTTSENVELKVLSELAQADNPEDITVKFIKELKRAPQYNKNVASFMDRLAKLAQEDLSSLLPNTSNSQLGLLKQRLSGMLKIVEDEMVERQNTIDDAIIEIEEGDDDA